MRPSFAIPSAVLLLLAAPARAELSEGCSALGQSMVEHSCFHSTFGPFVSVPGDPGDDASPATPNVDAVHTEYRVGLPLPGAAHVVTYAPQRSGSWSIFTGSDLPLEVIDEGGTALPQIFAQRADTGCDALPIARVFKLTAKERYTLRLGPADAESVVLVIEYADDFLVAVGRDEDGDGHGSGLDAFVTNCAPPTGYAPNTSDCDDQDPEIHPAAVEHCDDVDENCNGSPDDVGLQCRAGTGACVAVGTFTCEGDVATCQAEALAPQAESCNGKDDDCNGTIDDDGDALCEGVAKPRCVRRDFTAFCGCLLDADCGDLTSGRVCDLDTLTCRDGCSSRPGGNACPENERCETEGGVTTGICVAVSDEVDAPPPDRQVQQRGLGSEDPEAGCQCSLGANSARREPVIGLLIGVASLWLRRRRRDLQRSLPNAMGVGPSMVRRLPAPAHRLLDVSRSGAKRLALCVLGLAVFGCGGKTAETDAPEAVTSTACPQQVGDKPISHACSHTTNGPFENVVASPSSKEAPNVDAIHVSYLVELPSDAPGYVVFTPSRDGEHLLLLDRETPFTVMLDSATQTPITSEALPGCETARFGEVYELSARDPYLIRFSPSDHSSVLLFFEHLATFGDGAWQEGCLANE